jgi:type II secretory ATPase GspE/PulE/Tfp pilus assembly ATPase PilB-like protein
LKLNDAVRDGIVQGLPAMHLKRIAMATGMRSLRQSALTKMAKGLLSAAEVTSGTLADSDETSNQTRGAAA